MPTAFIVIQQNDNAGRNAGSRDDLQLNVPIVLTNENDTGVTAWLWQLVDKPAGSTASLTTPTQSVSGFTPDSYGTYLIMLTINNGPISATVGAAIKTTNLKIRIPAAKEDNEFDSQRGWASAVDYAFKVIDDGYGNLNKNVATISDLRAAPIPTTTQASVVLDGYSSVGDGGEGIWYWDATSTEIDNTGTIIQPTAVSGAGRWKRSFTDGKMNVMWFGAKADHADDLGARIIAADAALGSNDGVIEVPDGYYLIHTHFVLGAGHVLRFGKGIIDNDLDTGPIITLNDRTAVIGDGIYTKLVEPKVTVQGTTWQVVIADFNTFGTGTAKINGSPGAASAGNVDLLVENIKFVKGSEFTNSSQALIQFGNVSRAYVKNCYFEEASGFAVSFGGSSADGYHAEDCEILDCYAINCATQVFAVVNCNRFTINRNSIIAAGQRSTPATYIDIELNSSLDVATNWIISDNIFDGRGAATMAGYAIQVVGQGVPIENDAVAPDTHIGIIANNTFFGGDSAGADFWQAGITLVQAAHILVEGNVIQHSPEGINLFISLNCTVRNNHLAGCGSGGVGAIQLSGSKYCIVQDNTLILDSIENFNPANHIIETDYFFDSAFRHPDFNSIIGNSLNNNPPGSLPASNSTYQPYILLTGANSRTYGNFINGRPTDDTALLSIAELRSAVYPGFGAPSPVSKFVRIAGWLTPGDGGAGTYVWNDPDTRADDGMFIIKPNVITEPPLTGRWNRSVLTSVRTTNTPVIANTLVKMSTTSGLVEQFLTTDKASLIFGITLDDDAYGGSVVHTVEIKGQQVQLKSDGTTVINSGDLVEPSTTVNGRIKKGAANPIGVAIGSAAATLDALVSVLYSSGVGESNALQDVSDTQITTTNPTNVLNFTPTISGNYQVMFYYRVVNAPTDITISLSYNDNSGNQIMSVFPLTNKAIGSYSAPPIYINALNTAPIILVFTAGIANNVFVSATIE